MARESLVNTLIWLKEDLQISKTCQSIRKKLLASLQDATTFSPQLTASFHSSITIPYCVSPSDPLQIAAIKKIINALDDIEKGFRDIEQINVKDERYFLPKPGTVSDSITTDLLKILPEKLDQLSRAVKLIDKSGADVQAIVGSHISTLLPKLGSYSDRLASVAPSIYTDAAAKKIGAAVDSLPTAIPTGSQSLEELSKLYFKIPSYLEYLQQKLVAAGALNLVVKSTTSAADYQAMMLKKANETQQNFEAIIGASYSLLALPSYISALKKMVDHSADLVSTAAPLTKQAYLDAAAVLNQMRHEIIPELVTELEKVEESACLKPNVLAGPVITQLEGYYLQLVGYVDGLAQAAGVLDASVEHSGVKIGLKLLGLQADFGEKISPIAQLNVLRDDGFDAYTTEQATRRLVQAELKSKDKREKKAAEIFFGKITTFDSKTSLADASPELKATLLKNYKQFQPHFAELYPEVDLLIVTQLTRTDYPSFLAKSTWYIKQLWGSMDCKAVLDCRSSVVMAIQQSLSQAAFESTLIQAGSLQRAHDLYAARGQKTELQVDIKPFKALEFAIEDGLTATAYEQKRVDVEVQLHQLTSAKTGLDAFFNHLLTEYPHDNPNINQLTEANKEELRIEYKKFQSHIIAEQPDAQLEQEQVISNELIVDALSADSKAPLLARNLLGLQRTLGNQLDVLIEQSHQNASAYAKKAEATKLTELATRELKPMGAELQKKTLFGQISNLQLSTKLQDFIDDKYNIFLIDNLTQEDSDKLVDARNLPFVDFYEDNPNVVMHKQVLNALYHLKTGFSNIEALDKYGYPSNVVSRGRYLKNVLAVVTSVTGTKSALSEAAKNPGLAVIMNEGLKLLDPLKNIPIIGSYLKPTAPVSQQIQAPLDIVAAWEAQQVIIGRNRGGVEAMPEAEETHEEEDIFYDAEEPISHASYVQQIADQLYRLPQQINAASFALHPDAERQVQEQSQALVDRLSGLSYGPESVKQILLAAQEMNLLLTGIGKASRDIARQQVAVLPATFGATLLSIADTAEFHIGLPKSGEFSKKITETFGNFYSILVESLTFKKEQDGFELIVKMPEELLKARIFNEVARRDELKAKQVNAEEKARESIFGRLALFEPLKGNVATSENRIKFLKAYDKLQPILEKIDNNYDRNEFLRRLREPKDFDKAIIEILSLKPKLEKLIVAEVRTRNKEIARCNTRIADFNQQIEVERGVAEQKISAFKDKLFDHYLNANVRSQFETDLGPYTKPFMANISREFVARKADILLSIRIMDDVELRVKEGIDTAQAMILQDKMLLKNAYAELNALLTTLKDYIQIEEILPEANPCRQEKIEVLRNEQQRLIQLTFSADTDVETINGHKAAASAVLNRVTEYNSMIKIYDMLDEMQNYLIANPDSSLGAKVIEIEVLKGMLTTNELPLERLRELEVRGTSAECRNILSKNSDNMFVKMLKLLWSFITGWQNKNDKVSMFNKAMADINVENPGLEGPNQRTAALPA